MGSLNGDVMVVRNGRSTSQVSVYNYPEHLNPFYEDDQHKRLRFWKISKRDSEGRRNSFSIGNLKDMWAFKSFRMKKKSSTLGINKTSESPPLLRRDYALENGWNTFDHRLRANNTSSMNDNSFQRNATYRSSLQTLPTSNDRIGLNRNDGYRSTIQVPRSYPRYQPQQKQIQQTVGVSPNRRSSQSSMVSSNPFESDDDDHEDINSSVIRSEINGSTTTLTSRTPRKKRRAPAPPTPPTPIHGRSNGTPLPLPTIRIESSQDNTEDELRIKEDMDIANLTAEIESFVKTKSNDDIEEPLSDKKPEVTKVVEESKIQKITATPKVASTSTTEVNVVNDASPKEKRKLTTNSNGQVSSEIIIITTTTTKTKAATDVTQPVAIETKVSQISNEVDESKQTIANGAIPKKLTSNSVVTSSSIEQQQQSTPVVADLCIKETTAEDLPQKPVPLKRQTIPEAEVGSVECIHVHVESPKATPRRDQVNALTSFKATEADEIITTKTPFVLTSPPAYRRQPQQTEDVKPVIKGTVRIVGTTTPEHKQIKNELNIKENQNKAKPEISVKPALSPKPVIKESNGKMHSFAEIHKPMRRNNQNGHVKRVTHEDSISPPIVPQQKISEEERKISNEINIETSSTNAADKPETIKRAQLGPNESLKIIETTTSFNGHGDFKPDEKEKLNEIKQNNVETPTTVLKKHKEVQKRDDELDFLYRPKPASHMEWKRSTLAPLETNIPPEKRKSVKDIIESINRSQRLLNAAANKDFPAFQNQNATTNTAGIGTVNTLHQSAVTHNHSNNKNNLNENNHILDKQASTDAEDLTGTANSPSPSPSNCNNENIDNNELFQKCKVKKEVYDYRETSPISSNLDWNPVPKPKRTKAAHE